MKLAATTLALFGLVLGAAVLPREADVGAILPIPLPLPTIASGNIAAVIESIIPTPTIPVIVPTIPANVASLVQSLVPDFPTTSLDAPGAIKSIVSALPFPTTSLDVSGPIRSIIPTLPLATKSLDIPGVIQSLVPTSLSSPPLGTPTTLISVITSDLGQLPGQTKSLIPSLAVTAAQPAATTLRDILEQEFQREVKVIESKLAAVLAKAKALLGLHF